ncbi:unnamed protein product [Blepharisma stoltei]|uniref:RING-type domain-containing protein n=1 Tax=Blepharisma stoltei TaxID=1481888 RepID=A0AAU9KAJ5_9CILI|nr:unnamed protein product [Blepharisma stoltei]
MNIESISLDQENPEKDLEAIKFLGRKIPPIGFYIAGLIQCKTKLSLNVIIKFLDEFYESINLKSINEELQKKIELKLYEGLLGEAYILLKGELKKNEIKDPISPPIFELPIEEKIEEIELTCSICSHKINGEQLKLLEKCDHMFHSVCLEGHLQNCISSKMFPIKCPLESCESEIQMIDMEFLSPELKRHFEEYSTQQLISSGIYGQFVPCPKCGELYGVSNRDRVNCTKCKLEFCINCERKINECRCFRNAPMFNSRNGKWCPFCALEFKTIKGKLAKCDGCGNMYCIDCLQIASLCTCNYEHW